MSINVVGIDLAKSVFQICALQKNGKVLFNKRVTRKNVLPMICQFEPDTLIAVESCGTSHYWGREFEQMGFTVRLIPPQHVKPFVKNQKNDANDALAICEAALRPNIHFVPVKSAAQQDFCALQKVRQGLVRQRTRQVNQIRALAREYGVNFNQSIGQLQKQLPCELDNTNNGLTAIARRLLQNMHDYCKQLTKEIKQLEKEMTALGQSCDIWKEVQRIPGIGPITAAALLGQVGSGEQFNNGRQMSSWLGLIPRQHSSGSKIRSGRITKQGNVDLRCLLVHGARAALRYRKQRKDALGDWLQSLVDHRGFNKAAVAYANKCARMAWVILSDKQAFCMEKAFSLHRTASVM